MKKSNRFLKIFLFLICFPFLTAAFSSKALAYIPGEKSCQRKSDCEEVEGYRTACFNQFCVYIPITPLDKINQTLKECKESGSTSLECYTIGTGFIDQNNGTLGSFSTMTMAIAYSLIGAPPSEEDLSSTGYKPGGAIGFISQLTASLYSHPPVSGVEYFADLGKNLGFVKPAYAQGVGFAGFSKLLPLWKASRNLAYIFFIITFLYIGLAVMFRLKLDPRTVVTIQNALPKLVIALILVTFSYAIVGLMIDLIYVLINLGVLVIGQAAWPGDLAKIAQQQGKYTSLSFAEGLGLIFGAGAKAFWSGIAGFFAVGVLLLLFNVVAPVIGVSVAALPLVILAVIALFCIFKLFFALLTSYIYIILSILVGPLQIMMGVLPGSQGGFGSWFKNLLANILVFPAVALFLLLGNLLCGSYGPSWTPPVIASSGRMLSSVIGFGLLLLLPKIPDAIKTAITKAKPSGYGTAIGQALGPVTTPITKYGIPAGEQAAYEKWFYNRQPQTAAGVIGRTMEKLRLARKP